jgi:hypothetical protein
MSAATAMMPRRHPELVPDTFRGSSGASFWRVVFRPAVSQINHTKLSGTTHRGTREPGTSVGEETIDTTTYKP